MTLLRELIYIPEHVQKGDFVLRLSEGVIDPAGTLGEYVVTPELVRCFDQALDFVRDSVTRRNSPGSTGVSPVSAGTGETPVLRSSGWGELESAWDATRFEAATEADPGSEERTRLVSDLVGTFFKSYSVQAERQREAYLSMDKGLCVLSQHARNLGYDALLLFLDELILWLATRSVDLDFIQREAAKLTTLVEAQTPDRPIPVVSFVARQRDLRKL